MELIDILEQKLAKQGVAAVYGGGLLDNTIKDRLKGLRPEVLKELLSEAPQLQEP